MRPTLSRMSRTLACALGLTGVAQAANPNWPNGPNDDPRLQYPDDPSYINIDANGKVTGGEWNFWSFVPADWADNKNFRQAEVALGTGIHADRAWQHTIGDRRVVVAVLDSGIEWDHPDLQMKHYLSRSELKGCLPAPLDAPPEKADEYDVNGDGIFNIADYLAKDPAFGPARDGLGNKNGLLDPGDLIRTCSDGVDDDGNGFTDDISGWDAYRGDNDPYDDTRYGHGTGEARDSVGAGNNGIGGLGVCPECTLLNVRVGDSFVVDVNEFATGVIFAVDSGASVVQEALGSVNNSAYAQAAIEYAYRNNVVIIASAADELSFHHNMPGTNNHTVYVHAIVHDDGDAKDSTTFLNFNNCTNFGAQLLLSTPGGGCSSEATGITSGHAGLVYSAALDKGIDPPLTSEEVRGLLIMSADDIDVPESVDDDTKFPSGKGWDLHFGYGRNNARRSLDFIYDEVIPPEADIAAPLWFEPINVRERKTVDITGRVGARVDGLPARYSDYTWTLEWAVGVDPKGGWKTIESGTGAVGGGTTPGLLATWDVEAASKAIDFTQKLTDPHQWTFTLRLRVEATSNGKPVKSEFRKAGHFINDPDLHEGWPKNLNTSAEGSPKIFDIDGDGPEEVIVATTDGYIHAFKIDGSEAAGFPIALPFRREMDPAYAFNITEICAFRPEGDKGDCGLAGHVDPTLPRQTLMLGIGVGALTGTAALSIVVATFDGFVYVYGTDGKLADGWPQKIDQEWFRNTDPDHLKDDGYFGAPVLYDLDGNGDLEIIAAGMDAQLYVWHHDGKPADGFPVLVRDPLEDELAHIIVTPAVGDIDNDGYPEIVVGTNEVYGGNEGRAYAIRHTGASAPDKIEEALEDGWPVTLNGVAVNVLPLVGRGSPANPVLADLDGDGTLEANLDSIGYFPSFYKADGSKYLRPNADGKLADVNNADFGKYSDSEDTPAFVLINSGTFADLDKKGGLDFFKGTAGFDFALAFAEGGKRAVFDHQVGGWDTDTFQFIDGFPRKIEDWQFFMNPTAVDIDGDGWVNLLNGSGGYLVHAWNHRGDEPPGWPKNTGGWVIASPSPGDLDGDGKWDVFNSTRNGWMFAWKATGGVGKDDIEWQTYSHDFHNTNNYEEPKARYNDYPETSDGADAVDGSDATDATDAADGSDATDATDATDAADGSDATDAVDATDGSDGADATDAAEASDSTDGVAPAASSDDGCTTGTGNTNAPMWAFLLLGAVALMRRLRRA